MKVMRISKDEKIKKLLFLRFIKEHHELKNTIFGYNMNAKEDRICNLRTFLMFTDCNEPYMSGFTLTKAAVRLGFNDDYFYWLNDIFCRYRAKFEQYKISVKKLKKNNEL